VENQVREFVEAVGVPYGEYLSRTWASYFKKTKPVVTPPKKTMAQKPPPVVDAPPSSSVISLDLATYLKDDLRLSDAGWHFLRKEAGLKDRLPSKTAIAKHRSALNDRLAASFNLRDLKEFGIQGLRRF
jgi:hypothetical protein